MPFIPATKKQSRLRLALVGPSGSGKTYTALSIAEHLGERVAVVDTERGSASKYSHRFRFDVLELETFPPDAYIRAIQDAEKAGYDVLVLDSLSHAWAGKGGLLEFVDQTAKRSQSNNSFAAWREATPKHNALIDAMLQSRVHLIVTMRSKVEYVVDRDPGTGKMAPRKVGMQPVQREGLEYEFDVVGDLDQDNNLIISKTRCEALHGQLYHRAGAEIAAILRGWLTDGVPLPVPVAARPADAPSFDDLVSRHGEEAMYQALGGRPPADDADLIAIAAKLDGVAAG
jgi:hypothetical protein